MTSAKASAMTAVRNRTFVAVACAGALFIGGCSGSTNSTSSSPAPAAPAPVVPAPAAAAPDAAGVRAGESGAQAAKSPATVNAQPLTGQKLARVASLSVAVSDIRAAAGQARAATNLAGGLVLQEDLNSANTSGVGSGTERKSSPGIPEPSRGSASLTIQVPADKLDPTIDRLSALGTVMSRGAGSEDVTAAHVDTQSRIRTLQASLDRVRALMAKATTLDQVVALEREVTNRQSDLEALQAQLAALGRRVDTATISLVLTPQQTTASDDSGATAGIGVAFTKGWQAFVAALVWVVSALASLVPFALVVVPLWWLGRRIWRRQTGRSGSTARPAKLVSDDAAGAPAADRTPAESGQQSR